MPVKNATKRPQHVIDEAVKRFMAGESAVVLAKYYKISKPGFYLWVKKYKEDLLAGAARRDMSPAQAATVDREAVIAENMALKQENTKLRNKLVSLLIKTGEL